MISVEQIKAARGLLEWGQADLSEATGLHVNAINNIERRRGSPRQETLMLIKSAFEGRGVRFRGLTGLELVQDTLEIRKISGPNLIRALTDDILLAMHGPQDELVAVLPDERLFLLDAAQNDRYYKAQKVRGFRQRVLFSSPEALSFGRSEDVRFLPEALVGRVSYQIYADRFVLMNWQSLELLIIRSTSLADSFRSQFDFLWAQAHKGITSES